MSDHRAIWSNGGGAEVRRHAFAHRAKHVASRYLSATSRHLFRLLSGGAASQGTDLCGHYSNPFASCSCMISKLKAPLCVGHSSCLRASREGVYGTSTRLLVNVDEFERLRKAFLRDPGSPLPPLMLPQFWRKQCQTIKIHSWTGENLRQPVVHGERELCATVPTGLEPLR